MAITPLNTLSTSQILVACSRKGNSPSTWTYTLQTGYWKRDGFKDSLYRTRIGRHPPLAFTANLKKVVYSSFMNYTVRVPSPSSFWYSYYGEMGGFVNHFANDFRVLTESEKLGVKNSAIANANSDVKGQHYSAFETLYEGKKTADMIVNSLATLVKGAREVKRGKFLQAARTLGLKAAPKGVHQRRSLESNWLEYRYGWIPLYSTVYGEMKRQYDLRKSKEPEYSVTGYCENVFSGKSPGSWVAITTPGYVEERKTSVNARHRYSVSVGYTYRIHNPTLANTSSLGLTNPALLAWEAVPFSFVADWFVNVSDVLDQFDTWAGKTFLHGYLTTTDRYYEDRTVEVRPRSSPYIMTGERFARIGTEQVFLTRQVLTSAPTISFRASNQLNKIRILDGISLFKQVFLS